MGPGNKTAGMFPELSSICTEEQQKSVWIQNFQKIFQSVVTSLKNCMFEKIHLLLDVVNHFLMVLVVVEIVLQVFPHLVFQISTLVEVDGDTGQSQLSN